ncbi:MAG: T9SS type A sorting domain-containing protein [candidate division WOR-3 bacterium]
MKATCIFVSFFLMNIANSLNFRLVAVIPSDADVELFGFDTDHDGKQNLIFCSAVVLPMQFWEYIGFDRYILEDTAQWSQLCDVGYLDSDSLVDMVGNRNAVAPWPLYVYESPTYNSNPTNIVWQDSGFMNICGGYITDLDQDGLNEILFGYYDFGGAHTCVYENIGDNQYMLVWEDTINPFYGGISGDFDLDGRIEFITSWGGYPSLIHIWECRGDNNYESTFLGSLPAPNGNEVFKGNDMDGNNKPEFLVTCVSYLYGRAYLYLYETIGDNNYDFFLVDSIAGIPISMWCQRSSCGDIDADGKEEIVWSTFNQWHVYKATSVHQYENIYNSAWTNRSATCISINDLNNNGYSEVIEAGLPDRILIWEIQGVKILQPNYGYILHPGEDYQIIWQKFDPPGADSFALFFSSDNGNTYDTIALGIPGGDTTYQWLVPDVISDSCKIMIWAYGPPRPGENRPRGVAWDFGDFKIRPLGIENDAGYQIPDASLKILQNPVINDRLKIQYAVPAPSKVKLMIYNVLGQVEQVLVDEYKPAGIYEIEHKKPLTSGVYFVKLFVDEKVITKKCVILKD